jgi:hypothetical protein
MRGLPASWIEEQLEAPRIGEILVAQGVLNKSQLSCVLGMQKDSGRLLGEILVDLGLATQEQIDWALSQQRLKPQAIAGASSGA